MESDLSVGARAQLDLFCRQYLQLHLNLEYPDAEHLRNDTFQRCLNSRLFEEHTLKHAPPQRYQLRTLKELTKRIEESIQDWEEEGISDDIMNYFSALLVSPVPSEATSAQQKAYVTYALSYLQDREVTPSITLLEFRSLVAAVGTTGLRTWEAALHLGNYLCSKKDLVQGKSVLELGAGTGYISVLCARHLRASHILSTDGSDEVVASLGTNFYLNGLQDSSLIDGKELKWGQALVGSEHPEWHGGRTVDLVLGADLTYGTGNLALLSTFGDLFELFPEVKIILSATVRNENTLKTFLDTCRGSKYLVERIDFDITPAKDQTGPFYSDKVPINIYLITKPRAVK